MLDLTWKVFCMTGNIDTYLLMKELEGSDDEDSDWTLGISETELDSTIH